MSRDATLLAAAGALLLITPARLDAQERPKRDEVRNLGIDELAAHAGAPDQIVVGVETASPHGHVVFAVPAIAGGRPRVYDGNLLGALGDLRSGTTPSEGTSEPLCRYLTERYDPERYQKHFKDPQHVPFLGVDDALAHVAGATREARMDALLSDYAASGNVWSNSFNPDEESRIKWYAVRADPARLSAAVRAFAPSQPQGLRCNELFAKVLPHLVSGDGTANAIAERLAARADATRRDYALALPRAKLEMLLARALEERANGERLLAKAQRERKEAEQILALAKEDPADSDNKLVIDERAPRAIKEAKAAEAAAELAIRRAQQRIRATERAIANLPPDDSVDRVEEDVLSWYGERISKQVDDECARNPGFVDDAMEAARLATIIGRLRAVSLRPAETLTVRILKSDSVNQVAAATGTFIYVEQAYLNLKPSDDELLFVLGHELAHAQLSHAIKHELRRRGEEALNRLQPLDATRPGAKEFIHEMAVRARMSDYDKSQESQADLIGAELALGAGGSPRGISDALDRIQAWETASAADPRVPHDAAHQSLWRLTADHPAAKDRRLALEEAGITF
jgi:hypothetical protein